MKIEEEMRQANEVATMDRIYREFWEQWNIEHGYIKKPTEKQKEAARIVIKTAQEYNINTKKVLAVVACESNFNKDAINYNDGGPGKHSVGAYQFQKSTFDSWSKKMGQELDYYSITDQSKVASYMIANGQIHQWSCARMI